MIDLVAILPFGDYRFLRLFRLAKLARCSKAPRSFGRVLRAKREDLLITISILLILLVVASSLMYYAEPGTFSSIPEAMWWGESTLTTVGSATQSRKPHAARCSAR